MASVNKVIILGNLGKDPEVKYAASGDAICNFSVATTEKWTDKSGDKQEKTEWHRITFFKRLAEIAGEYLKKGSQCYIEGRLQTRSYEKDGVTRYTTEIIGDKLQLLGGGGERSGEASRPATRPAPAARRTSQSNTTRQESAQSTIDPNDDIPF